MLLFSIRKISYFSLTFVVTKYNKYFQTRITTTIKTLVILLLCLDVCTNKIVGQ